MSLPWHTPPQLCGEPIAGANRQGEDRGRWVWAGHQGVSSPQVAPHELKTHRKKRRAGHLQDRPWSRADAWRADWLVWRDRSGDASAHRGTYPLQEMGMVLAARLLEHT